MKKGMLIVMGIVISFFFVKSYALENLGVLPGEEIPEAVIKEAKIYEERIKRQSELIKKKGNSCFVGGFNFKLMSIFRKETNSVLVSTDGGKFFMGYPLPPLPVLDGACFIGMAFKRVVDKERDESDELSLNFEKDGFFGVIKLIKLDFNPETQTWKCEKNEAMRTPSHSVYRYEDLIS